jgi:uncharacterized protein (TIGR00369 family)
MSPAQSQQLPPEAELVAALNAHRGGFEVALGLQFTRASEAEIACELEVGPHLTQPFGLVHGGVYAAVVETLASVGANIMSLQQGRSSVGLENTTSFVHAVRAGKLRAVAVPLHRGRATQLWQVEVRDDAGKLAAHGRVRLISFEPGASLAGETVALRGT